MSKIVATGVQDFEKLRVNDNFYVDKTDLIREWWNRQDEVTLITRPRRFGKTLNMSMLNCFFSNKYANRGELFAGLRVWEDEKLRKLQGSWPVIFLTFAGIKYTNMDLTRKGLNLLLWNLYNQYEWMIKDSHFSEADRSFFRYVQMDMTDDIAAMSINRLCEWLYRYYGKKVLVFLDEYDTPLQEAYIGGFWEEMAAYIRALYNNTFKTNPSLERGIMTGITRVSKESIFSDLNNLVVVTTTSDQYADCFGFTEEEVFRALKEQGFNDQSKQEVKNWYDGFMFGKIGDMYNPWSITNYLKIGKPDVYWANTSSNGLVGKLIREGDPGLKMEFEKLLLGESLEVPIDEEIVFNQLDQEQDAIWSLLLASGYLKAEKLWEEQKGDVIYQLKLTNYETEKMFRRMVMGWFSRKKVLPAFTASMLSGNVKDMNRYLNRILLETISYFDGGKKPGTEEPEKFYHGLVLGLLVECTETHLVKSNRESGYGRYDVVMEPKELDGTAVIMEFKVFDRLDEEKTLEDTCRNALLQIEEKQYDTELLTRGIPPEHILRYGLAFSGKECLINKG